MRMWNLIMSCSVLLAFSNQSLALTRAEEVKDIKVQRYGAALNFIKAQDAASAQHELFEARLEFAPLGFTSDDSTIEKSIGALELFNLSNDAAYLASAQKYIEGIYPADLSGPALLRTKVACVLSADFVVGNYAPIQYTDVKNRNRRYKTDQMSTANEFCLKRLDSYIKQKCRNIKEVYPNQYIAVTATAAIQPEGKAAAEAGTVRSSCQ